MLPARGGFDAESDQRRIESLVVHAHECTGPPGSEGPPLELRADPARQRRRPDGLEGLHPPAPVLQADQRRLGRGNGRGQGEIRRHRSGRLSRAAPLQAAGRVPLAGRPRDADKRGHRAVAGDAGDRTGQPRHPDAHLRRGRLGQPRDARRRAAQGPHGGAVRGAAGQHDGRVRHPRRRLRVPDRASSPTSRGARRRASSTRLAAWCG